MQGLKQSKLAFKKLRRRIVATYTFTIKGADFRRELIRVPTGTRRVKCVIASTQFPNSTLKLSSAILLESGFYLLKEDGSKILLE
jgi:hypothetical protein